MSRKALFTNLGAGGKTSEPAATTSADPSSAGEPPRVNRLRMRPILGSPDLISDPAATPVGAIGQSLGEFSERAKRADEIERKLTAGQVIVELDPALIAPSFIADRMPASAETVANLAEAIREHGQLNPILVRPDPGEAGRFQVAFGHRRLRAVASLGQSIKAVVRELTDEQLVIAQGQENHERKDLSYVEKARFAHRLEQRFSRATIMAALSIYKSDLSNMLSVVSKIPAEVIDAIGPAPGTGRRGWIELAERFADGKSGAAIRRMIADPGFQGLDSDERFKKALAALKPRSDQSQMEVWPMAGGGSLAKVTRSDARISLTIDRRKSPEFADFVLNRLRDLYLEFEAASKERP
ncbi:plasmid partitioning protein RepB [Methylocella tundrae]|uniref:Putative replication protein B n=1 Tax=Methylocella tundrae TaxID=227605 RepID=A0A4U8Z784_METTU|nr:plasmid partitioning protein RepB [Methylocella tundrae]WPP02969.1 plasmid partitioning protein RepB [Methylocella tundrae]VFU16681.1 putative replication protein B [Methylocella tundrae]